MSQHPNLSGNPPPYYAGPYWPPPPHYPPPHFPQPHHYPPGNPPDQNPGPYPYLVPGTVMIPVPYGPPPPPEPPASTYITNYIYHGESSNGPPPDPVNVVEMSGDFNWVPTTSSTASQHLTGKAVSGGHEGWDGSPLWIIRAWHNGDLIPGKLSVRHNSASVIYDGKEIPVQNIEVLCCSPDSLRWLPASNGNVPPGAVAGGHTASGETLYVGRARYQLSITPGKVHPSHNCCYIGFAGNEVSLKVYEVLSRI